MEKWLTTSSMTTTLTRGLAMVMHKIFEGAAIFEILNGALEVAHREKRVNEERNIKILVAQIHVVKGELEEALKKFQLLVQENPRDFRPYLCQMGPTLGFRGLEFGGCGPYNNINSHASPRTRLGKNWLEQSAESMELVLEDNDSEEERVENHKGNKVTSAQLSKLQEINLIMKFLILISQQKRTCALRFCYVQPVKLLDLARLVILVMAIDNNLQKW